MKKKIIMITNQFPFGKGESFVKNEVIELEKKFDLTIIPFDNYENMQFQVGKDTKIIRYEDKKNLAGHILGSLEYLFEAGPEIREILKTSPSFKLKLARLKDSLAFYLNAKRLYKFLLEKNIGRESEILYSYWNKYLTLALVFLKKKNKNLKIVTRATGHDLYNDRYSHNRQPFKNYMFPYIDKIIFISDMGYEYYKKNFDYTEDKLSVSKLGTIFDKEAPFVYEKDFLHLLSCSNLIELKRVNLIVDTLSKINNTRILWTHVGSGPLMEKTIEYSNKLLADKANITFEFLGQMKNQELFDYYRKNSVDYFITTSSTEGIPFTIIEAMSFSIPFIGTDVGGIKELFENNGILVEKDFNIEELALMIEEKAGLSKEERLLERKNAKDKWMREFNAIKNFKEFSDIIDKL